MDHTSIRELMERVARGVIKPHEAVECLRMLPFDDLGCAKHDSHRVLRNGFSEVIYCEHKTPEDVAHIVQALADAGHNVLGTRASTEHVTRLRQVIPHIDYDEPSRTFRLECRRQESLTGTLAIACGGTADIPVAEEAWQTARFFGIEGQRYYDVGVAGLHRVLAYIDEMRSADVVIAVAGMEGALPSVLGGLINCPIVAVPTSVGYGANFGGITALLAMLNSCSEGIVVTNIDNGFGGACAALRILRRFAAAHQSEKERP